MSLDLKRSIVIEIDGSGAVVGARKVEGALKDIERSTGKTGKTISSEMDSANKSISGLAGTVRNLAAAFGAYKLAQGVKEVALLAARYDTLGIVMGVVGNNAGYTRAEMDGFESSLRNTGISAIEARNNLAAMASANMDLTKSSKLARIAQDAAVIGNINSSEAFQRLIYGIKSAQVEVLRTIGLNVNFENSYKKLADQLGKTSADLTESEKSQARLAVVMETGATIAGAYEASMESAGKKLNSTARYAEDAKVKIGAIFQPALVVLVDSYTDALKEVNRQLSRTDVIESWARAVKYEVLDIMQIVTGMNMALAKAGQAAAAVGMGVYGPGAALGVTNSEKGFEHFAQAYIDYQQQYTEGEKTILSLLKQQDDLSSSVGKQTTDYIAEQQRIAAGNLVRAQASLEGSGPSKAAEKAAEKEAKAAQKAYEKMIADGKSAAESLDKYWSDYEDRRVSSIADQYEARQKVDADALQLQTEFAEKYRASVLGETAAKIASIDDQSKAYIKAKNDEVQVTAWAEREKLKLSTDWQDGVKRGLEQYADSAGNAAQVAEDAIVGGFTSMEDALVDFVTTGKMEFSDFADSIIADMARMAIQQSITGPLASAAGGFLSNLFGGGTVGPKVGYAKGGIQSGAGISAFSSSIVSKPTVFPFARGIGLMGEAGPEAIMPLKRGPDGSLGVSGGGSNIVVNVIEAPGNGGKQEQRQEGGVNIIDVFVEQIKSSVAGDISSGRGQVPAALAKTYGLNRALGSY